MNKLLNKIITLIGIALLSLFFLLFIIGKNPKTNHNVLYLKDSPADYSFLSVKNTSSSMISEEEKNTINIYDSLNPAVVNITFYKTEYLNYFFEVYPQKSEGQGSGVIIDPAGYIVTNYHVVGDADRLTVALSKNEDIYEASIVGVSPEDDLAVIKIKNPPDNLKTIPLGNSDKLKVGQKVFAIGNPFGLDRTLTSGIISGLGRPIKTKVGTVINNAIQTDASINPGNSGGPLIDSSGKMIGINTMIISPSGGSIGLGFAIPVNTVKDIVEQLLKYGYVKRGWIDATFLPINRSIANSLGYAVDSGLMIMNEARNGEAYKAGLRGGNQRAIYGNQIIYIGGDIIIAIDGIKITDYSSFVDALKDKKPGEIVTVDYIRKNKKYSTKVKLIDKRLFTEN